MSTRMLVRIAEALERIQSELRRSNEDRDRFYREVLEVLGAAKDPDGSLRSEQPAAALTCYVCEGRCDQQVTYEQWRRHHEDYYQSSRGYGFTPGGWKFIAVVYALLLAHDNFAEAHSPFTWAVFVVTATCAGLLALFGHRPSPRKLWRDKPAATSQREGEDG